MSYPKSRVQFDVIDREVDFNSSEAHEESKEALTTVIKELQNDFALEISNIIITPIE